MQGKGIRLGTVGGGEGNGGMAFYMQREKLHVKNYFQQSTYHRFVGLGAFRIYLPCSQGTRTSFRCADNIMLLLPDHFFAEH